MKPGRKSSGGVQSALFFLIQYRGKHGHNARAFVFKLKLKLLITLINSMVNKQTGEVLAVFRNVFEMM